MPDDLLARIRPVINEVTEFAGMELVHLEFRREGMGLVLRLYIDKDGGVTLDDCALISRQVSTRLDVDDPIQGRYTLEVSSPGMDRPLSRDRDFERFAGHRVRLTTHDPIDGQKNFIGRLGGLEAGAVRLLLEDGRTVTIPRDRIAKTRLQEDVEAIGAKRGTRGRHA